MIKAPWERGEYQLLPGDGSQAWIGLLLIVVSACLVFGGWICLLHVVL
jgi:hypothetical protein